MDVGVRRLCGDAAEDEPLDAEGVGATEDRADVVHAAYAVQDEDKGQLGARAVGVGAEALHLGDLEFAHYARVGSVGSKGKRA